MASLKSREITEKKLSPGSLPKDERPKSPAVKIPSPPLFEPFQRLFPFAFGRLPGFFFDMVQRYGNIVEFKLPFRTLVIVNDPAIIKDVLVTQQHAFVKSEGGRTLRLLLGDGLLTSEEPLHRERRRSVQPAFHHERIASYVETMREFAQAWTDEHTDRETMDLAYQMSELTLRIASVTLFGTDASSDTAEVREALNDTMETYPSALGPLGKLRRRIPFWPSTRRFRNARARLDAILYRLIAERRAEKDVEKHDALSMLLDLSDEEARDEAMTLFLAGHETTANALLWTWYLLAANPEVEEKFHAAVDCGDNDYVRNVFKESMRLYPPAWILGREALHDVELVGGYPIKAKTTVFISQLVLQRTPEFFPDPLRFDPDRWTRDAPPQYAYAPFGAGSRRCIGEEFAWLEGVHVLTIIAKKWRFEMLSSDEPAMDALVTLRPHGPVMARIVRR
jgi:cytochrome P450